MVGTNCSRCGCQLSSTDGAHLGHRGHGVINLASGAHQPLAQCESTGTHTKKLNSFGKSEVDGYARNRLSTFALIREQASSHRSAEANVIEPTENTPPLGV